MLTVRERNLHINKIRPFITRVSHIDLIFKQDSGFRELYYAPNEKASSSEASYTPIISNDKKENNRK